jgi:putative endonuclease
MTWVVYILECADSTLYTGSTNNLEQRIARHRSGDGAKYTRGRHPLRLVYTEPCENRSAALKREAAIKSMDRKTKLALI